MKKLIIAGLILELIGVTAPFAGAEMNGNQPEIPAGMNQPPVGGTPETTVTGVPKLMVEFQRSHADIPSTYSRSLNAFGKYLKDNPNSKATIVAYADHSGLATDNSRLAQKRADTVAQYLMKNYGISASRISAQGAGEVTAKPNNETLASQQADRRAYATITNPG